MGAGKPNAVLTRLSSALDALPLLSNVCAQASDVPGAVIRLAKAFGHPDSIVFNTLESINEQLIDHRDLVTGEAQAASAGSSRTAAVIDQIEQRIRAARNFDRANASSGLADPNAAKLEITANQAILQSPSLQALALAISDTNLSSPMRLHMIMKARENVCLKAFYERKTVFSLSAPCTISADAHRICGPYLQWVCLNDENGNCLPRCKGAPFFLNATDIDRLVHGKLDMVNWAAIGAAFCKITLPAAETYSFPSSIGAMPHVVDLFFPVFKRIFIALGFAPAVFEAFEDNIIILLQNTLPGEWLTGLINESFRYFLEEKTNELAAFIGASSLSRAVFPGVPDGNARSAQVVAAAVTRGDETLRMQHHQALSSAASASLRQPLAAPALAPSIPPASPASLPITAANASTVAAHGTTPGGGKLKLKGDKRKFRIAAASAAPVTAPTAANTNALSPGRKTMPGSNTGLVKANASGTLLKIGKSDVFDAEQLVMDVRARSPGFNVDLKRDILLLAAWLAEGSEGQRARFVPAGCDRRFIEYPFSPFEKQNYITSKNFH